MILVLGTGRSGTSEVAGMLHNDFDIHMGNEFPIGNSMNPKGYWEDREFMEVNMRFMILGLHRHKIEEPWRLWRELFNNLMDKRKEPWGIKDPRMADSAKLLKEYLKLKPDIILCTRNKEDTIHSLKKYTNFTYKVSKQYYERRVKVLEEGLKDVDYLEIDCYDEYKEEKIEKWLEEKGIKV